MTSALHNLFQFVSHPTGTYRYGESAVKAEICPPVEETTEALLTR